MVEYIMLIVSIHPVLRYVRAMIPSLRLDIKETPRKRVSPIQTDSPLILNNRGVFFLRFNLIFSIYVGTARR